MDKTSKNKISGATGTNQYRVRGMANAKVKLAPTLNVHSVIIAQPGDMRCGEVWGSKCQAAVYPPDYAHADHPSETMKLDVAQISSTPTNILFQLARDKSIWVRQCVAWNPNTPTKALVALTGDEDIGIRGDVARHRNTPAATIARLAGDESIWVRQCVAWNPNTPVEVLSRLAGDEDGRVRYNVARNLSAPAKALTSLIVDEEERVRTKAKANPNLPTHISAMISLSE